MKENKLSKHAEYIINEISYAIDLLKRRENKKEASPMFIQIYDDIQGYDSRNVALYDHEMSKDFIKRMISFLREEIKLIKKEN